MNFDLNDIIGLRAESAFSSKQCIIQLLQIMINDYIEFVPTPPIIKSHMLIVAIMLQVDLFPIPQKYTIDDQKDLEVGALEWSCTNQDKDCTSLVQTMKGFYEKTMFPKGAPTPKNPSSSIKKLHIDVVTLETPRSAIVGNESHNIHTNSSGIFIYAFDLYAVSRALATVSQLIESTGEDKYIPGLYTIKSVSIADHPVFNVRLIMLDTARHFLPKQAFIRQIQALAISKFNVLHIHIIDDESNAFQPISKPAEEYGKAAYNTGGRFQLFFDDLKEIAQYAHNLGVHIIIEYDQPGHASSWRQVNPEIAVSNVVNPINELTYDYIQAYIKDLIDSVYKPLNKDIVIHLGGDEVNHGAWNNDPNISAYMKKNNLTTNQLWRQFHKRVADIITKLNEGATRIYWEETFDNDNELNEHAIVHVWLYANQLKKATDKGHKTLRSNGWYLDMQKPGQQRYLYQDSWQDFYQVDPYQDVQQQLRHLVLGGGACQWGEKIHTGNLDEHIWPRALAVSEILWAYPASRQITPELKTRLNNFVCKLMAAGVQSGPLAPSAPCPGADGARFD